MMLTAAERENTMTIEKLAKMTFDQRVDWAIGEIAIGIGRGDTRATMSRILNAIDAIAFREVRETVRAANEAAAAKPPFPESTHFSQAWLNQINKCLNENDPQNAEFAEILFWRDALEIIANGAHPNPNPMGLAREALTSLQIFKFERSWK